MTLDDLKVKLFFLVMEGLLYKEIIRDQVMKELKDVLDLGGPVG